MAGVKGRSSFPVYADLGDSVAVPRFSKVGTRALADGYVNHSSTVIGNEDEFLQWAPEYPLKPEQLPGAGKALDTLKSEFGCLIKGDTGSGKTVVGLNMAYWLQPARTLILVDQLDIAKQWAQRARQFLPNVRLEFLMPAAEVRELVSCIGVTENPTKGVITIATAQSLHRSTLYSIENQFQCELLICDEVHVFGAPTFMNSIFKVNYGRSIGLTATDDRKDGLDWVFRQCLGWPVVEFVGEVMTPIVYKLEAPSCGLKADEWRRAWCRQIRGFTWLTKCRTCVHFDKFPYECGGRLPLSDIGNPKWDLLNRAGLVSAWAGSTEYQIWLRGVVDTLMKKRRNIFFFGESRAFLLAMYAWAVEVYGETNVGIYMGKGGGDAEEVDVSFQRHNALEKPLTFATYGVARKALDVKEKDAAVFATPISDARQAAGRVRRTADGKKQPIIIVPVPSKIYPFVASWNKLAAYFKEAGWTIRT